VTIAPDDKDWTWVLERRCPECGLDVHAIAVDAIPDMIRANATAWGDLLVNVPSVRARMAPQVWSPLEYGCHVRDVLRLYDARLMLMLIGDDPLFPNWDQDRTAVADRYGEQDPETVRDELLEAATRLADDLDRLNGPQWDRPGRRSDGAAFTVASFARYLIHDPVHHLYDVTGHRSEQASS
jgi:hypothetical protein